MNVDLLTLVNYKNKFAIFGVLQARLKSLQQWPLPSSANELKSFLGGINFYRKFI